MYTTLDYLEQYQKKKNSVWKLPNLLKEIKNLWLIFGISAIFFLIFTNAQLFFGNITDSFKENTETTNWNNKNIKQNSEISALVNYRSDLDKQIDDLIKKHKDITTLENAVSASSQSNLKNKLKTYNFGFNILPPTDRIIIPAIWIDVPLVSSNSKPMEDFMNWNFDDELRQWIVRYPTTPSPGEVWNSLVFGHTSTEFWQDNWKYWTVLKNLPELQVWDKIQVIWKWNLYEYEVFEEQIVYPAKVSKVFDEFQSKWEKYLSIMWCYPIGKSDKRMIKIAKLVE